MNQSKVVGRRKPPRTPQELHALGARLDRELAVVRPFSRKRGFVFKARTWDDLVKWESQRLVKEHRRRQ
ncbi:MAG TPA: hypothetical protein VFU09_03360 [Candidatus Udaeobacter sp.]|nr:hypothetical protein [Candidatus Udaeobacter sp.]